MGPMTPAPGGQSDRVGADCVPSKRKKRPARRLSAMSQREGDDVHRRHSRTPDAACAGRRRVTAKDDQRRVRSICSLSGMRSMPASAATDICLARAIMLSSFSSIESSVAEARRESSIPRSSN